MKGMWRGTKFDLPILLKTIKNIFLVARSEAGQGQLLNKQKSNIPSVQPISYNSLSCKDLILLFMFATMSFLTAIILWKFGSEVYCVIIGVYKALKAWV